MREFNLLVSSARGNERDAGAELRYLLRELGDPSIVTGQTGVSGLLVGKTALDPLEVVARLRPLLSKSPWQFRYVLKVKPIMRVVRTDTDLICEAVAGLVSTLKPNDSFRVSVQKRHSKLDTKPLIDAVAKQVPRRVDLTNPDKILLIEIVADLAGISIVAKGDILAVELEKKRRLSSTSGLKVGPSVPVPNA